MLFRPSLVLLPAEKEENLQLCSAFSESEIRFYLKLKMEKAKLKKISPSYFIWDPCRIRDVLRSVHAELSDRFKDVSLPIRRLRIHFHRMVFGRFGRSQWA